MQLEPPVTVPTPAPRAHRPRARSLLRVVGAGLVALVLPFFVTVRSAVYLYDHRGTGAWLAVLGGFLLTLLLLTGYAAWGSLRLSGRLHLKMALRWIALPLVLLYGGYSLLYLSQVNAKSPEVQSYFRSLHPVLRVAVSTLILFDRDLVITDLGREPADYARMGLPAAERSLHYPQEDGYVHAMDLRTVGRPAWRSQATDWYFRLMGFRTLRHIGTADHLHVSIGR